MVKRWLKTTILAAVDSALAIIGTFILFSEIDWKMVVSASLLAGLLAFLYSARDLLKKKKVEGN